MQVHKAKLRSPETPQPRPITKTLSAPFRATGSLFRHLTGRAQRQHDSPHRSPGSSQCEVAVHTVNSTAESAWTIANTHGVSMQQLRDSNAHNKEVNLGKLEPGDVVALPTTVPAKSGAFMLLTVVSLNMGILGIIGTYRPDNIAEQTQKTRQ